MKKVGIRNVFLMLLACGLFLIAVVSGGKTEEEEEENGSCDAAYHGVQGKEEIQNGFASLSDAENPEMRLKKLLSGVKGVGKAEVMITYADAGEKQVLKDTKKTSESLNEADAAGGSRVNVSSQQEETTVYEKDAAPFVTKEYTAKVAGVVIVCEGGGNAEVAMKIVSATEALFGVAAHRIVVLEMK